MLYQLSYASPRFDSQTAEISAEAATRPVPHPRAQRPSARSRVRRSLNFSIAITREPNVNVASAQPSY